MSINYYHWQNSIYRGNGPFRNIQEVSMVTEPPFQPVDETGQELYNNFYDDEHSLPYNIPAPIPNESVNPWRRPMEGFINNPDHTDFETHHEKWDEPQTNPWTLVSGNKHTFAQIAAMQPSRFNTLAPSTRPVSPATSTGVNRLHTARKNTTPPDTNPESWLLSFPRNKVIPKDEQRDPAWIVSQVNSLREANPSTYRFTCLTAKWTASDNITLRFTKDTITADVERAKVSIQQKICHGMAEATLKRNNTWTTIILPNVPCYNTTTEEFEERHLWTEEHIERELRKNGILARIRFGQPPKWSKSTDLLDSEKTSSTVVLQLINPDSSVATQLTQQPIYMWGVQIRPRFFKPRFDLIQYDQCFNFGKQHDRCPEFCRLCASTQHMETDHKKNCMACHHSLGVEVVNTGVYECAHLKCKNCNDPHVADDETCKARAEHIASAKNHKGTRPPNQPILDTSQFAPSFAPASNLYNPYSVYDSTTRQTTNVHPQTILRNDRRPQATQTGPARPPRFAIEDNAIVGTTVFHVVSGYGRIGRISRTMATLETGQDPPYEASEHREDTSQHREDTSQHREDTSQHREDTSQRHRETSQLVGTRRNS